MYLNVDLLLQRWTCSWSFIPYKHCIIEFGYVSALQWTTACHHKCLSYLFTLHLNTYVMSGHYKYFYSFSAGIDFRIRIKLQERIVNVIFICQGDGLRTGSPDTEEAPVDDPMKVIHKDQDGITAFCINQVRPPILHLLIYNISLTPADHDYCWF